MRIICCTIDGGDYTMDLFSKRLRQLRMKKKMTQISLSTRTGLSQETISAYERSASKPSVEVLARLADFFDVSADYLMGRDDKEKRIEKYLTDSFEMQLISNYRKLERREKEFLVVFSADLLKHYGKFQ